MEGQTFCILSFGDLIDLGSNFNWYCDRIDCCYPNSSSESESVSTKLIKTCLKLYQKDPYQSTLIKKRLKVVNINQKSQNKLTLLIKSMISIF